MVQKMRILTIFSPARRIFSVFLVLFLATASLKCQSIQYYNQAIDGQMDILRNRRSITELLDDPATPVTLREELLFVLSVRTFAEKISGFR
jgi:predicted aminopeptidase